MTRSAGRSSMWPQKVSHAFACAIALLFALGVGGLWARAEDNAYLLRADDGSMIANARVPLELARAVEQLLDVVVVGGREGSLAIAEFCDLNCPYCRKAAPDIANLIRKNKDLRIVLVSWRTTGAGHDFMSSCSCRLKQD